MGYQNNQLARWLSMTDVKVKRSKTKEVSDRVASGKCLLCDSEGPRKRGLCLRHYMQFVRTISAMPKGKRIAQEEYLIREGLVLPVGQMRELQRPNPFLAKDAS